MKARYGPQMNQTNRMMQADNPTKQTGAEDACSTGYVRAAANHVEAIAKIG